jgi:hypothetical protein
MPLATIAKIFAAAFAVSALTLLSLGISTLYWPTATATVESSETARVTLFGYGTRGAKRNTDLDVEVTRYTFSTNGQNYTGSLACFCLPLGWKEQVSAGSPHVIAYFSRNPRWSVMFPGPDILSICALAAISLMFYLGSRSLAQLFGVDV